MQSEATYYKMTSRKRNKGKERKAKKLEAEQVAKKENARTTWQYWARGEMDLNVGGNCIIQCNHGCNVTIPDDDNHPVCGFMDVYFTYFMDISSKYMTSLDLLRETFNSQPQVWKHDNFREMAINILVGIGTNQLLAKENWSFLATAIVALENYNGSGDLVLAFNCRGSVIKRRDIQGGNMRDLLKFYRKRTTCKCLKDMHLGARKTQPKLGECYHCKERKERALLMVCSRCRILQYCSRECQVADWAEHKGYCEDFVSAHDRHQMTQDM